MQIIPLSEGSFTIDTTKQFIPFNLEKDDLQLLYCYKKRYFINRCWLRF